MSSLNERKVSVMLAVVDEQPDETNMKKLSKMVSNVSIVKKSVDEESACENIDVNRILLECGFAPIDKIITEHTLSDNRTVKKCEYVAVLDSNGNRSYVKLDVQNAHVSMNSCDTVKRKIMNAKVLPYSIKINALDCLGMGLCGIAFQCNDKVCVVNKCHMNDISEDLFIERTQESSDKVIRNGLEYPIIRMSVLMENCEAAMEQIKIATDSIRRNRYEVEMKCLNEMKEKVKETYELLDIFEHVIDEELPHLHEAVESMQDIHHEMCECKFVESDKQKQIFRNLIRNHNKFNELFAISKMVTEKKSLLVELNHLIRTALSEVKEVTKDIEYIL